MSIKPVALLLVTFLTSEALALCQDDDTLVSDSTCLGPAFSGQRNFLPGQALLMDSYALINLDRWTRLDQDGVSAGIEGQFSFTNSLCQTNIRVCSNSLTSPNSQRNWLFTHFIRYPSVEGVSDVQELFLQVNFRFQQCSPPVCTNRFIDVFRYDVDGPVAMSALTNIANYEFIRGTQQNSRLEDPSTTDVDVTWAITRPTRANGEFYNGLYIGLRDMGNCGTIGRVLLYYNRSPGFSGTLLTCPSVPLPREGVGETTTGVCCCDDNAQNTSTLMRECSNPGGCVEPAADVCGCSPGFQFNDSSCQACLDTTFQPDISIESDCVSCPNNSVALFPAAGVCDCTGATIRNPDRPRDPCAEAPSSPILTVGPVVDGTFVRVCWGPAVDSGGLSDLHYNVYIRAGGSDYNRVNPDPIVDLELCYDVPGLSAETSYTVVVVSANGATGDPETLDSQLTSVQGHFLAYFVGTGQAAGLRREAALAVTFFITFLVAAVLTGVVVGVVMWFLCVKNSTMGTSPKTSNPYTKEEMKATPRPHPLAANTHHPDHP